MKVVILFETLSKTPKNVYTCIYVISDRRREIRGDRLLIVSPPHWVSELEDASVEVFQYLLVLYEETPYF